MKYEDIVALIDGLNEEVADKHTNVPEEFIVAPDDKNGREEYFRWYRLARNESKKAENYLPSSADEKLRIFAVIQSQNLTKGLLEFEFTDIFSMNMLSLLKKDSKIVGLTKEYLSQFTFRGEWVK